MDEVLPYPRLSLGEERGGSAFMLGPDRPGRDGDHDASIGVDDDPQNAGSR